MVPKITLLVRNYLSFFASDSSHMVVWASSSYIRWRQKLWGWGINRNIFFSPQKDLWSPNLLKTRQVYWCAGVKLVVRLLPDHWWCPCGGVVRPPPPPPAKLYVRKFSSALHHRGPTKSCPLGGGGQKAFRELQEARHFSFLPGTCKFSSSFQLGAAWGRRKAPAPRAAAGARSRTAPSSWEPRTSPAPLSAPTVTRTEKIHCTPL